MRSGWCPGILLGLTLAMAVSTWALAAPPPAAAPGLSVTVQPGESWSSVRTRLFPLDALQQANPQLDPSMLHPGEVVRAPYVPVSELDRARAAREAADRHLADAKTRLVDLDKDRTSLETRRRELARAEAAASRQRGLVIGLAVLAVALLVLVAFLVAALRTARRAADDAVSRHGTLESRYDALRASLHEVDLGLQRRVMALLQLHGGRIVTEAEVQASLKPVIDLTRELKRKHRSA